MKSSAPLSSLLSVLLSGGLLAQPPAAVPNGPTERPVEVKEAEMKIDLRLIRRAVTSKLMSAKEAKQVLEFDRLRQAKDGLTEKEIEERLAKIGISREKGEELVQKLIPAVETSVLENGDFEVGEGESATGWQVSAGSPPKRSAEDAHEGTYSMHVALQNKGGLPSEGLLSSSARVEGGESYQFEFWIKPVEIGASFIMQYRLQWQGEGAKGGTGYVTIKEKVGEWSKVEISNLEAPEEAEKLAINFRFVTGAVKDGHGEALIDGVALKPNVLPAR